MKNSITLVFLMLFVVSNVFAQNLSIADLIYLRDKDFNTADNFLLTKGWAFSESKKGSEEKMSKVEWAFSKDVYGQAVGWFSLNQADYSDGNIVDYQFASKLHYAKIKAEIKSYNMKLVNTDVDDGEVNSIYEGSNYSVELRVSSKLSIDNPSYTLTVKKNGVDRASAPTSYIRVAKVSAVDEVNVRKEADESSAIVFTMRENDKMRIISESNQFFLIENRSGIGYVLKSLVTEED